MIMQCVCCFNTWATKKFATPPTLYSHRVLQQETIHGKLDTQTQLENKLYENRIVRRRSDDSIIVKNESSGRDLTI